MNLITKTKKKLKNIVWKKVKWLFNKLLFIPDYLTFSFVKLLLNVGKLRKYLPLFFAICFFVGTFLIILITSFVLFYFDLMGLENRTIELGNYFLAGGAMLGGMLAIVFSLSMFAIQKATDLFSARYIQIYIRNWQEKGLYVVFSLITISFFYFGLVFNNKESEILHGTSLWSIYYSFVCLVIIFVLIYWHYNNVIKKANPVNAINFLWRDSNELLKNINTYALKVYGINKINKAVIDKKSVMMTIYSSNLPIIEMRIQEVFEISMRLADKGEIGVTKMGIATIRNILVHYLSLRKKSSFPYPAEDYILAWDSDSNNFLAKNYEKLEIAGTKFIQNQNIENARFIVQCYQVLCFSASEIEFSHLPGDNPIFFLTRGYLYSFLEVAMREKEKDVLLIGILTLPIVAKYSINKNLDTATMTIFSDMSKIALFALTNNLKFLINKYIDGLIVVLKESVFAKSPVNTLPRQVLSHISELTSWLQSTTISPQTFTKAYDDMLLMLDKIVSYYNSMEDDEEKEYARVKLLAFFEELYSFLRSLSTEINICNNTLSSSIGQLISFANQYLLSFLEKDEFEAHKDAIKRSIIGFINLPSFFIHKADTFNMTHNFTILVDSTLKDILNLYEKKEHKDLLESATKALYAIVKYLLKTQTDKGYYVEPRIMFRICLIGILAQKQGHKDLVEDIILKIYEFEYLYYEKHFGKMSEEDMRHIPTYDIKKLFKEFMDFRSELGRLDRSWMPSMFDDAEGIAKDLITVDDVDRFIFAIWESYIDGTYLKKEFERKIIIRRMIRILKKYLETKK